MRICVSGRIGLRRLPSSHFSPEPPKRVWMILGGVFRPCFARLAAVGLPTPPDSPAKLNTHGIPSLYPAFEPELARGLTRRLEIHYTPKHGGWLNIAEIALGVLSRALG